MWKEDAKDRPVKKTIGFHEIRFMGYRQSQRSVNKNACVARVVGILKVYRDSK